ncbi:MAG: putative Ig domain-containing protein, partial [Desulfuromonadales bacterium]|nr:putative Ig domain-containing protein [Desulfuromonadales bacterium]
MRKFVLVKIILSLLIAVFLSSVAWGKTVTLSWDASPSVVAGYKIYYDTGALIPLAGSGAAEGVSPIDVGDALTFTVNGLADDFDHYFAVSAYDAAGNESSYSNTVYSSAVSSENNPPALAAIGNKSVLEGVSLNFTISATDADGDSLTYNVASLPDGAGFNSATGAFSWTPASTQANTYSITFSVSDGTDTASETIQITVTDVAVNHAPVLAAIGNKSVDEGDTQSISITASDADGDNLSYLFTGMPTGAVFNSQTNT